METNPYDIVGRFERQMADYCGAMYAVALDSCTAAIFLCCKYFEVDTVKIPKHTFVGVPNSIIQAGGKIVFTNEVWSGCYQLKPYPIFDSACRMRRGMFLSLFCNWTPSDPLTPKTGKNGPICMCLSFQHRKHIPIGRGGMVLTNSLKLSKWLKLARFFGRHPVRISDDKGPEFIGWNMYMEPDRAARGLMAMHYLKDSYPDLDVAYPNLSKFTVYKPHLASE